MLYCSLGDIGASSKIANISIQAASEAIEEYTGDTFYQELATAKIFSGRGRSTLLIKPRLTAVTLIEEYNETSALWEEIDSNDYDWYANRVTRKLESTFLIGNYNVRITGNWGWTSVPAMVKLACIKYTKQLMYGDSDEDIASEHLGSFSASYKKGAKGGRLTGDVASLLNRFVLHKIYGGRVVPAGPLTLDNDVEDPRNWNT